MPIKQKKNKKTPHTKIFLLILVAIAVISLTYFLVKSAAEDTKLREQQVQLDESEIVIRSIADEFIKTFSSDELNVMKSFKDCNESSVKYGRGTVTCGPGFTARIYTPTPFAELSRYEDKLKELVEKSSLDVDGTPYVDDDTVNEHRLFSMHTKATENALQCYATLNSYTSEGYLKDPRGEDSGGKNVVTVSIGCNEITKEPIYPLAD